MHLFTPLKIKKLFSLLPVLIVLLLSAQGYGKTGWAGEYFFDEDGGETVGGSKIYVAHTLTVSEANGALNARLYSQGFQTSYDIFATAESDESKLILYFDKFGPDQVFEGLKKGDLMFSLHWIDGRLITNWGKFRPILTSNNSSDKVRFLRSTPDENGKEPWERLVYADGEVSVAVPAGFIYDDRRARIVDSRIYAYYDGVSIQLARWRYDLFKNDKFRKSMEDANEGVRIISPYYVSVLQTGVSSSTFSKRIQIVGPKFHLEIELSGHVERLGEIDRFIDGLQIKGAGLNEIGGPENIRDIDAGKLKRSEAVKAALKMKSAKIERKISYEIKSNNTDTHDLPIDTRGPIVLKIPVPSGSSTIVPRILLQLRADGAIGDMVVFSSQPPKVLKKYVEAAEKVKFIPAVRDGKNVDSWTTISFPVTFFISR